MSNKVNNVNDKEENTEWRGSTKAPTRSDEEYAKLGIYPARRRPYHDKDWVHTEYGHQVAMYLVYHGGRDLNFQTECLFLDECFKIKR